MAKSKQSGMPLWGSFLSAGLYKRNQGRLTRQLSALAFALILFFGCWTLSQGPLAAYGPSIRIGIPMGIAALGAWIAYRLVNHPPFADFLISVEAEMDKVSWASKNELIRATIVVLVTMFFLGFVLLVYDVFWHWLFTNVGFLYEP